MSSRRFCPQCGEPVTLGTELRVRAAGRTADAEGFCLPSADGHRARPDTGCAEHLRRFDPGTGARLEPPPRARHVDPWSIAAP